MELFLVIFRDMRIQDTNGHLVWSEPRQIQTAWTRRPRSTLTAISEIATGASESDFFPVNTENVLYFMLHRSAI